MDGRIGRREAIRRTFLAAAALFGLTTVGTAAGAVRSAPAGRVMRLSGTDWHRQSSSSDAGLPPEPGERAGVTGVLVDEGGDTVGTFRAASFLNEALWADGQTVSLEFHTFDMGPDVLFGLGEDRGPDGVFAVVGGTGRFSGARGSYKAVQSPYETGGDGTAHFEFTLL